MHTAHDWDELKALIISEPITAVIVEPGPDGPFQIDAFGDLIEKHPELHFMLYTSVSASGVNTVLQLNKRGLKEVLTQGVDDSPRILREKLEQLECSALAQTDFRTLVPPLSALPPEVANALEKMFQTPQNFSSGLDLAREAGTPLSRLYRSFELAHLPAPKDFLIAAKVWHGYSYLKAPGHTVRDVAARLGYNRPRVFVSHVLMVLGVPPSALRSRLPVTEARRRVLAWLEMNTRAPAIGDDKPQEV